jgi:hypothetical protein
MCLWFTTITQSGSLTSLLRDCKEVQVPAQPSLNVIKLIFMCNDMLLSQFEWHYINSQVTWFFKVIYCMVRESVNWLCLNPLHIWRLCYTYVYQEKPMIETIKKVILFLFHSTEQSPSRSNNYLASQICILWIVKIHGHINEISPIFPVLSNINSVHTLQLYIHETHFNNIAFLPMNTSSKYTLSFRFSDKID